jgi:hypothetical protein
MRYEFECSVECRVEKDFAWGFWSDVANWSVVDPSVEAVTLDGDFAAGTKGLTKPRGADAAEWELLEVVAGESAVIGIFLPGAVLKFYWKFADSPAGGTLITQRVELAGGRAGAYAEGMKLLEKGIPEGMQSLAKGMSEAAGSGATDL